jgi:hypothetical protein
MTAIPYPQRVVAGARGNRPEATVGAPWKLPTALARTDGKRKFPAEYC